MFRMIEPRIRWVPKIAGLFERVLLGALIATPVCAAEMSSPSVSEAWSFHAQATVVTQGHSIFNSPYSGQNSLVSSESSQTSETLTFAGGFNLHHLGEVYLDPELTGGSGLSKTLGLAGFPNGEIYRVDNPAPVFNIARVYWKKVFGWGSDHDEFTDQMNQIQTQYSRDRLTFVLGKFALNDFFDNNSYSHDPRSQFLNWALMDHGAWDYASDNKGYTWGCYLEWNQTNWAVRFATVEEPLSANSSNLDPDWYHSHGDNLEFEYRWQSQGQPGALRLLIFENHANMGNYQQSVNLSPTAPDITTTRGPSLKYGLGLNLEQQISTDTGIFSRVSWNNGQTESWAFTEIDQSASIGYVFQPHLWSQKKDRMGVAAIVNGLSNDHKNYLQAGGYGFLIGDGQLNYATEKILETYYQLQFARDWSVMLDAQGVSCPGYNADRGPVSIFALRLHYEI